MRSVTSLGERDEQDDHSEVSDQHVWSVIRYLDPERTDGDRDTGVVFAVFLVLVVWGITWAVMHYSF